MFRCLLLRPPALRAQGTYVGGEPSLELAVLRAPVEVLAFRSASPHAQRDGTEPSATYHNASVVLTMDMIYAVGTIQMGRGTRPGDPQPTPVRTGSVALPRDGAVMKNSDSFKGRSKEAVTLIHSNPNATGGGPYRLFRLSADRPGFAFAVRVLCSRAPYVFTLDVVVSTEDAL